MKVIFKDPYTLADPTIHETPAPVQTRTHSGRFNGKSILSAMTDDHFPIDSRYWSNGCTNLYPKIEKHLNNSDSYWQLVDGVLPTDVIEGFSYRMIFEMMEVAYDAIKNDKNVTEAIEEAHTYLTRKQAEIAMKNRPEGDEALQAWMTKFWEFIPEEAV